MVRWLWFVGGCAHAIPPVSAPAAPVARATSAASACWVEYARSGAFTDSGVVVNTAAGVVLIDAGQSLAFRSELTEIPHGRLYLKLVPAKLVPDRPASEALAEVGVDLGAIVAFVPTHAHSDHVGGLVDLPDLPVKMDPAELEVVSRVAAGGGSWNVMPAEARRIAPEASALAYTEAPFAVFPRSADLLGDGTVVVVPLPGHTPGSVGVVVDAGAARFLHAGDAINTRSQLDGPTGKSPILRPTDGDPAAADRQVALLASLHAGDPDLVMLPAHERAAWVELFGA
ncbi:MAG: MBL fold metallo-hydrolase, partial [Myxococcota bacterium]